MLPHPMSALAVSETARPLTAHSKAKTVANVSSLTVTVIVSPSSAAELPLRGAPVWPCPPAALSLPSSRSISTSRV